MTLANKENAAILRKILDPAAHAAPSTDQVTDLELAALEASTQGGTKTAALAGAIFNNKDDKKARATSTFTT
ncbi:hypothetical protein LshimejAT787_1500710 [Lyophyllum shimeji]|uniref:Uncharacterized protein n=1 Tax=Lyophyllum shimeji TaxID=47721 RepID=A0A9P3UT65_LYOSH|nr:hypothetical protein LshimejAT787_1500710 [Lyophyllum shimeji]